MGFWTEILLGKREKATLVIQLSHNVLAGIQTLVNLHNSKHHELDHITIDDVAEAGIEYVVRKSLRIVDEEVPNPLPPPAPAPMPKKVKTQNLTPVFYVDDHAPRGRSQFK